MNSMFRSCTSFDQDISAFDVSIVSDFTNFMAGTTLSTSNYDSVLVAWELLNLVDNLTINFGGSKYTATGETAKNLIITDDNWTFTDGGLEI